MTNIDEILWRLERIENLRGSLTGYKCGGCDVCDHDEAKEALENIENEIIARACRNGVCED